MRKIANFVIKKKYAILVVMVVIALVCAYLMTKVEVNTDLTKYLPDDSNMKIGMDIMEAEFPEAPSDQTLHVMFDDLTEEQKAEIRTRLEEIPYVSSVTYEEGSPEYNLDNHTLYIVHTEYDYATTEEVSIEHALDRDFTDYSLHWKNDGINPGNVPAWVIITALVVLLIILLVMCGSWIEPFLFLAVIGIAIAINMGTNIFQGTISNSTFSIASLLQLVLSMDYSIILINRYRQEKPHARDKEAAMEEAFVRAFPSVVSSAMTTVVGLLMMIFMSNKIGMDLGIVLAKGVFLSMVSVLLLMPGVILIFDKAIQKTEKKSLHVPMNWAATFSYRGRHVNAVLFVAFFNIFSSSFCW